MESRLGIFTIINSLEYKSSSPNTKKGTREMNAHELADDVKNISNAIEALEWVQKASPLLIQQAKEIEKLEKSLAEEEIYSGILEAMNKSTPQIKELSDGCGNCHACLVGVMENNMPVTSQRMIVCSDCGNKRCPKASNHRHKCTGSNEVCQYGSIYTAPRELSDEEILNVAFCCEVNTVAIENDWDGTVIDFAKAILKKASEK